MRYFEGWLKGHEEHAVGELVSERTALDRGRALTSTVWLAPYDLGVCQSVRIEPQPIPGSDVVQLELTLERMAGQPENWLNVNKRFLASIRRQFLAWRTMPRA
jgi:hypothetical protein